MKYFAILLSLLLFMAGCNNSNTSSKQFDPCDGLRSLDPHCGWKPHWDTLGARVNKMDGSRDQHVSVDASDADGMVAGSLHYPELRLCFHNGKLCGGSDIGVMVAGHTVIEPLDYERSHSTSVRIRFDDGRPVRQVWGISDDDRALFPYGHEKQFANELLTHKVLYVEFSYYQHSAHTVSFQLNGLQEMLATENLNIS
jgi:hypothetical protein